jgi:Tfp pilus assembly protein PilO
MLIVTANYEGSYADLVQFVNALDRSGRLLIVESLTATPQQSGGTLSVAMRLNAFVQDDGSGAPAAREAAR